MTDLKTVNDHPMSLLNAAAADAYRRDGAESLYGWAYTTAATRLFAEEAERDVTFAALDNETLKAIREGWFDKDMNEVDFLNLVSDLLGLDDE